MNRLTHDQVWQVTQPDNSKDKPREWRICPVPGCGGHLHVFGRDEFACMGNSRRAPCKPETVATELHRLVGNGEVHKPETEPAKEKSLKPSELPDWHGVTLFWYSMGKCLPERSLEAFFEAKRLTRRGMPVIGWSYVDETGKLLATKIRLSEDSHDTYFEPADPHVPYGLGNPVLKNMIVRSYDLIIAEGETDTHTFGSFGFPVLGISGAEGWLPEYAELPVIDSAARVLIARHSDEGGKRFEDKILKTLPNALVLRLPEGLKDWNELHQQYADFEDKSAPHPFIQSIDIAVQAATLERAMRRPKSAKPKPAPMREEAFYGLAGEIVRLVEPALETDRAAILTNVLATTAVLFRRNAYCAVNEDVHYPNDYYLTVGNSAIARKGTTTDAVVGIAERVMPGFKDRILRGLSTGQGLIKALIRKPTEDEERNPDYIPQPIGESVLVGISEFSELLAVMKREENTLAAVLRDAWDGKPLAVLTRNEPLRVRNVSLATIAHITRSELLKKLTSTDRANGFANRFLFVWSERARLLPNSQWKQLNFGEVIVKLHAAIEASEGVGEIERDEETELLWAEAYKRLTVRGDTMTDALLARAEAHTLRLSLLYALLDSSRVIRKAHLKAALAVWDFCEESVRYVFGDAADPDFEKILRKLENAEDGLTTNEIRRIVFSGNQSSDWVAEKMVALEELRKVRRGTKEFKHKSYEAWFLAEYLP